MWNYLRLSMAGAKFHLVKDHLISQMEIWGAIGPFNKEFGEADHVVGNSEFRQFGCMQSTARRECAISQSKEMQNNSSVKLVKQQFTRPNKRRRHVTKNKGDLIKRMHKQALEEVQFAMTVHGNRDTAKIEDYWKREMSVA